MSKIVLRAITKSNFKECINLKVSEQDARFVAPNLYSLAEAKVNPLLHPFAVYKAEILGRELNPNDKMLGFVMYQVMEGVGFITRLMIDPTEQSKGYGASTMREVIRRLQLMPEVIRIGTSVHKENPRALAFYRRLGFTIDLHETEVEYVVRLDWGQ